MKKLLLAATFLTLSATAAQAQVNLDVNFGEPAYVVEPRPVVVEHPAYYRTYGHGDHHHNYDYGYWKNEHHDDHHDNGHHYGNDKGDHHR